MNRRQRKQRLDRTRLAARVAEGITESPEEERHAQSVHAANKTPSGVEMLRRWEAEQKSVGRVPAPKFHAENNHTGFVRQRPDGTKLADATLNFPPEVLQAIQSGMICLRCLEPQTTPFQDLHIEGCEGVLLHGERYMRDRQVIDFAMEFEGERHLGPSRPMQEFLDAQDERVEKRKFLKRVLDGGQGRIPKAWLADATLLEGLSDDDRLALSRSVG